MLCELAWKVRYLVGITGKAVVLEVPNGVLVPHGVVGLVQGENCQVPKISSRVCSRKSGLRAKESSAEVKLEGVYGTYSCTRFCMGPA